jgi:hypothetical protein
MGYSNFKSLRQSLKRLQIEEFDKRLFTDIVEVQPTEWLKTTLEFANEMPLTNEKSKSERLISPILMEATMHYKDFITLYSGEDLTVDDKQDLSGFCDFFIAKHPRKSVMQAPVITLCEAKDEDFDYGQGQCLAQMYAAQIFNEQEGHPQPFIYGCAVTGGEWKFLKLEKKQVLIDINTYYLNDLPKILGVFHHIIQSYLK